MIRRLISCATQCSATEDNKNSVSRRQTEQLDGNPSGRNAIMLLLRRLSAKPSPASHSLLCSPPPFASSAFCRFLSSPPPPQEVPAPTASPNHNFAAQYLINSCGLAPNKAVRVSRYLPHLKSAEKPDSVLRFLRQTGVAEAHIKAAASRQPSFLRYNVDKCLKPRVAELRELGFSQSDISLLLSISPVAFGSTRLQQKVRFWLGFFGSVERLLCVLKRSFLLLVVNPETTVMPNLAFLREQCGLPAHRISQLVSRYPGAFTSKPEEFRMHVTRAQELGVSCSSRMFVYALNVVAGLKKHNVDARLRYLKSLGFSQEEVTVLIAKLPSVLLCTEKMIGRKMAFLLEEAGCGKIDVVSNPVMLTLSLEKRFVPRRLVRELLKSKGIPAANNAFATFVQPSEKQFLEKFVLPYEGIVPGLQQAYTDACAGNITAAR